MQKPKGEEGVTTTTFLLGTDRANNRSHFGTLAVEKAPPTSVTWTNAHMYDRFIRRLAMGATEMDILTYVYDCTTDSPERWHMVKSLDAFCTQFFSSWEKGRARFIKEREEWLEALLNAPRAFRDFFYRWQTFFDARRIKVFLVYIPCRGTIKETVARTGVQREFDCYSVYYRHYEGACYNVNLDIDIDSMRVDTATKISSSSRRTTDRQDRPDMTTLAHQMLPSGATQVATILEDEIPEDMDDVDTDASSAVSVAPDSMSSRGDDDLDDDNN